MGQKVSDLNLPREVVLVSIRRGQDLIIPRGDTLLQAGDVVTALCERDSAIKLKTVLGRQENSQ